MNSRFSHCSSSQLNAYVDQCLSADEARVVDEHLHGCPECRRALRAIEYLDSALRSMPLVQVGSDFTNRVVRSLHVVQKSSFLFRVLEKVAYVFGLFIVVAIMLTAFVLTGVIDMGQVAESQSGASELVSRSGESLALGFRTFGELLSKYWSFTFGKESFGISVFIVIIVSVLAAVDKLLTRRIVHRLR
jgi:anti-sigma factor RsiW